MAEEKEEQIPNTIWTGKQNKYDPDKDKYVTAVREVPKFVMDGGNKIELPENLADGAFVEPSERTRLMELYPKDFKEFEPEKQIETDLPADFPMREVLRGLGLNLADVQKLDLERLMKLDGIGEKSADKILKYLSEVQENGE